MSPRARWLVLACLGCLVTTARAEEPARPGGRSIETIQGLKTVLVVPETITPERAPSLVVVLHAAAGSADRMADLFEAWPAAGYLVCAPEAKDVTWEVGDLEAVVGIVGQVVEKHGVEPTRVHLVGYSDGGAHLDRVAFDDAVRPRSVTWVAATYRGNRVPRWARDDVGVLALLGADDPELDRLQDGLARLRGKVRTVEVRTADGVGHRFPYDERPYLLWWMGVQEGRIVPGEDLSLPWTQDLDAALRAQEGETKGGVLLWIHGAQDASSAAGRELQQGVFLDADVRFLGRQLACVELDAAKNAAVRERYGVKTTPALVVLDTKGRVIKTFEETFSARKVAAALKKVAPTSRPPR